MAHCLGTQRPAVQFPTWVRKGWIRLPFFQLERGPFGIVNKVNTIFVENESADKDIFIVSSFYRVLYVFFVSN